MFSVHDSAHHVLHDMTFGYELILPVPSSLRMPWPWLITKGVGVGKWGMVTQTTISSLTSPNILLHTSPGFYHNYNFPPSHDPVRGLIWSRQLRGLPSSHHNDVTMGTIASQITSLTTVYSIVYSNADQRKHQSSASLAFVRGIHRGPVISPQKWAVTLKMFPFDDVIMIWLFFNAIKPWQMWFVHLTAILEHQLNLKVDSSTK